MKTRKPKPVQLLKALQTKALTTAEITRTISVTPSRARYIINELRREGHAIFSKKNGAAQQYFVGYPTAEMVRAAYLVLGAPAFRVTNGSSGK